MNFRVRRQLDGQFALEHKSLDSQNREYWRGVGLYATQQEAVDAAPAYKIETDAAATYAADVAAGRDIVSTFTL